MKRWIALMVSILLLLAAVTAGAETTESATVDPEATEENSLYLEITMRAYQSTTGGYGIGLPETWTVIANEMQDTDVEKANALLGEEAVASLRADMQTSDMLIALNEDGTQTMNIIYKEAAGATVSDLAGYLEPMKASILEGNPGAKFADDCGEVTINNYLFMYIGYTANGQSVQQYMFVADSKLFIVSMNNWTDNTLREAVLSSFNLI